MKIKQFKDETFSQLSYAVVSESTHEIVLIDPARNPQPYYEYAQVQQARIVGIIETHLHTDFVSSHLEIACATGSVIRVSRRGNVHFPHIGFDEGDSFQLGNLTFQALNTPGHSPESVSIVLCHTEKCVAVFCGDTLLTGDVGRPASQESDTNLPQYEAAARQLFHSIYKKLLLLADNVLIYPAHGDKYSNIGTEKVGNYALQANTEEEFLTLVHADASRTSPYIALAALLNKMGAPAYQWSISRVVRLSAVTCMETGILIIDTRSAPLRQLAPVHCAVHLPLDQQFVIGLANLVCSGELFYLVAADEHSREKLIQQTAKIGYETLLKGTLVFSANAADCLSACSTGSH
ncbi:MBL fold metallo-hydrolase [Hymenobacter sp. GOD-10R]|uniref:MBL fold metallo-hydrolase n=1 Tax=Hymenobacter sp. GOD-10R TaxID=3093922 RepID=UPI002D76D2CB|nr:MBL fold metallo-hydrolase [Hymenobacter sp. GOD-10R]WRQ31589.1 MBL fold metallo-hydrolase [Hymenobacter sp. GOD-10R]